MKCVINKVTKQVFRVKDDSAKRGVNSGVYGYCPKWIWKGLLGNEFTEDQIDVDYINNIGENEKPIFYILPLGEVSNG